MNDQREALGRASIALGKHLFGVRHDFGFVGIGAEKILVYVHGSKREWRDKHCAEWQGYPVEWRYKAGPIVAFGT